MIRSRRPALGLSLLLVTSLTTCTGPTADSNTYNLVSAAGILHDVEVLSDDDMEGRATGTSGEQRAATYIEERFREIGLEPLNGSYQQEVRLVGMLRDAGSSLEISGPTGALELSDADNVTFWSTAQSEHVQIDAAPLLFVGYGVEAPEYDWDDFRGLDVEGKVLLFLNNDPPVQDDGVDLFGGEARTYYGRWTYKFEQAMRHGAAGALMIHTTPSASYPFSVVSGSGSREHFALDLPESGYQVPLLGWIDEHLAGAIAASMGTDLDGLFAMGADRDLGPIETGFTVSARIDTAVRKMSTHNVVAMLQGSDPAIGDQVVVFSAHYDHIGVDPNLAGDDKIFNGAWDNAVGTASIIALAKAFAQAEDGPRRSLLFLACAAEEAGSLGSAWFVASPPLQRSRLVADFNIDMPQIFGITADLAAIGVETNSLGEVLRQAASEASVTIDGETRPIQITGDPNPAAGSFYRSDQVNFAKAGIPALFLNPGGEYVSELGFDPGEYEDSHYHQPSDEITPEWDLSGLVRDLGIVFRAASTVADANEMPRWVEGNEFEAAWRALHGEEN